jgi:hypothetical protein
VVLPSEWAIMDTITGPLYEAMFSLDLHGKKFYVQYFMFDDIENSPIAVSRRRTIATSRCISVDAKHEENSSHVSRIPVVSETGNSIELTFLSSSAANSILRTKGTQPADVDVRIVAFKICSIWHQQNNVSSLFHDGVSSMKPVFYRCPSLRGGDTIIWLQLETCFLDDKQSHCSYSHLSFQKICYRRANKAVGFCTPRVGSIWGVEYGILNCLRRARS